MYGILDVSTSGLVAQRTRLEVASANIANMNSAVGPDGNDTPYRRREVILATGDPLSGHPDGVHVRTIAINDGPLKTVRQPWHPMADADGNVGYPDIDPATETINAMEASRAYEANIMAAEATKTMFNDALRLLA